MTVVVTAAVRDAGGLHRSFAGGSGLVAEARPLDGPGPVVREPGVAVDAPDGSAVARGPGASGAASQQWAKGTWKAGDPYLRQE
ncbi:hypothetical protein POF50_028525 [Streptomyces sp. SL13]|uniref:Uncharacterized protein n=1 Tax=Streptantibioticus silvisoli TaxID=2705255 RepID=A0AA90H8N2_9ACTN|nr:hypothetical protein [Streptantibioticus silvisoli]MDI5973246.1 hypothetical protein [Streptantibioticus silvisoli]